MLVSFSRMSHLARMNEVQTVIHDVAFGGSGVGRLPDGKVLFVPYTLAGEVVRARLRKNKKGFSEGELLEVLTSSPHRVEPPCVYFQKCGGCQYQHATYAEQLRIKEKQVGDTLKRIGGFDSLPELQVMAAQKPLGYRNKISVHSGANGEFGFYKASSRDVVDVELCLIASDGLNAELQKLRAMRSRPAHIALNDESLRGDSPEGSFHQVNTVMAKLLLDWIREQVGHNPNLGLLDLYCGAGFFSIGLADRFGKVCGMDRDERAIDAGARSVVRRGIKNVQFFAADVRDRIEWFLKDLPMEETMVLLDPPRDGLSRNVVSVLAAAPWKRMVYVSCDPATLSRDLKELTTDEMKRKIVSIGLFDMFPQTAHIEVAVVLEA